MHKIQEKKFTLEDFSTEHLDDVSLDTFEYIIAQLEYDRRLYIKTKDKKYWWQMIQLLPSSYNQTRNVMMNYEVLANIYGRRRNHKLDEWREFCKWIEGLPYSELITGVYNKDLVEVTRCKDYQLYISAENMKKDPEYKKYDNKLGHDGLCEGTDKWTDETDYCSCGKNKEG